MTRRKCKEWKLSWGLIIALVMGGCGWSLLMSAEDRAAESFANGALVFEAGEYSQAIGYFRQIPPESSLYKQSVQMILKVPFERGMQAFESQDYDLAVSEFRKINKRSPDYEKAQYHIKYALFSLSQDRYQELKGKERLDSLWSMTKTAAELGESDILKSTLETVGYELENSSTAGEAEELLKMMGSLVATTDDPLVMQSALQQLLEDFERLHGYASLRHRVFQLIGNIKVGLM